MITSFDSILADVSASLPGMTLRGGIMHISDRCSGSLVGVDGLEQYQAIWDRLDSDPCLERAFISDYGQFARAWDVIGGDHAGNLDQGADRIVAVKCARGQLRGMSEVAQGLLLQISMAI